DYFPATINAWRASGCFDEFQRNLGYRLALTTSTVPAQATISGNIAINLVIVNRGYAPLYSRKDASIVFKNKSSGTIYNSPVTTDFRLSKPESMIQYDLNVSLAGIPAGDYDVYLKIADRTDALKTRAEYSVRLANSGVWTEDNGGMNKLNHTLKIVN
ncbi:MAG: DUF4832 domain-containing protein, partial [Pedobacter sp.]